MQNLGVLAGGSISLAFGISGDGSIVTGSGDSAIGTRAFRWTSGGGTQSLGSVSGFDFSEGYGISGNGQSIVGGCGGASSAIAFLWTPALGMVDLNTYLPTLGVDLTGWTLNIARGISADGSVIAGDGTFNGEARSFVVSNVPAPGAAVLLGSGGLVAARRRRNV
ncbi:MAG: hypothetical protein IT432_04545 [Phycisphaerales bacterium]|nr:hypothetical protein [Phycisphaerales bacterium]